MRKEELRHDPVREYIVRGVEYIKVNQSTVVKIFAGLVILVAGFSYYNHVEKVDFNKASNIAGLAQNAFINGDIDGSMVKFERVLEDYPNTSGAVQALVYLLNDALKQENYEEITNFISKYNGDFSIIDDRIVQASLFKILGDMALIDGNTDDALSYYRKAENASKGSAIQVKYQLDVISALLSQKNYSQALNILEDIMNIENVGYNEKNKAEELLTFVKHKMGT